MRSFELTILSLVPLVSQGAAQAAGPRLNSIYSFNYFYGDNPTEVLEKDGALYGAIGAQGAQIFRLTPPSPPGGDWTETVLFDFDSEDGPYFVRGRLAMAGNGAIYGATAYSS